MQMETSNRSDRKIDIADQARLVAAYHDAFVQAALARGFDPAIVGQQMLLSAIRAAQLLFEASSIVAVLRSAANKIDGDQSFHNTTNVN
jgi:hypothetical protein